MAQATRNQYVVDEWVGVYASGQTLEPTILFKTCKEFCPPLGGPPQDLLIPAGYQVFLVGANARTLLLLKERATAAGPYVETSLRARVVPIPAPSSAAAKGLFKYLAPVGSLSFDLARW